jgi:hypothetical protein
MHDEHTQSNANVIQLPRPTAWPMVLSLGLSLILAGMVTSIVVAILGLVLTIISSVGWFRQVLPHEAHEAVPLEIAAIAPSSARTLHAATNLSTSSHSSEIFHLTTGIKGGIAGGIAMIVPATVFSLLKFHSLWYAMNLLAAGGFVSWAGASDAFLCQFHLQGLLAALFIHGLTSLLVGLLYGAMLPMFPRYPIVSAGVIAPLLLSGILHSVLAVLSPILNQRIDWRWFVLSQFAFGLVCGFVVNLQTKVRSAQFQALPFAVRAGLHGNPAILQSDSQTQSNANSSDEKESSR